MNNFNNPANPASPLNPLNPLNPASPIWVGRHHTTTSTVAPDSTTKEFNKDVGISLGVIVLLPLIVTIVIVIKNKLFH